MNQFSEFVKRLYERTRHLFTVKYKEMGVWLHILSNIIVRAVDRAKMAEHTFMVIVAILIGLFAGFGAVGFRFLIKYFQEIFYSSFAGSVELIHTIPWYILIWIPTSGGLIVGLIVRYISPEVRGPGIPEVMEAVALRDGYIRPRVVIAKAFASAICIGSGGSVGREGPIVQIGSAIGSTIGQFLQVSSRRLRTFVGCGAAAGIAATFNAPVAGALFAVEVILGDFGVPQFSPIVISSVVGTVVARSYIGDLPAFNVPPYTFISFYELISYAIVGFLTGLIGYVFLKVLYFTDDLFRRLKKLNELLKPALGGLLVGILAIWFPQVLGVGYETINGALQGLLPWKLLVTLIVLKLIATSITTGSGGSGGVFAPSLFLGAMVGGSLGTALHAMFPEHTAPSSAYALVAMGALVSGTTHAPITAILIIFELTNKYTIILPLMISCIISTLVITWLHKESIYTMKLVRRGVNITRGKELNVLKSLYVRDIMLTKMELIPAEMPFKALLKFVSESDHTNFFVVNKNYQLIGSLSLDDIRRVMLDIEGVADFLIASDIASRGNIIKLHEDYDLDFVMKEFGRCPADELPVVDKNDPLKIIGTVWRKDVIDAYNKEIFLRDMAEGIATGISMATHRRGIELVEGFPLIELEAPRRFIGQTLGELNLRALYGVEVILIKRKESNANRTQQSVLKIIPYAQYQIEENDILLIMGEREKVEMIERL